MKVFELFEGKRPLTEERIVTESIKLCESIIKLLEADDFEWEPQPEFRGVKGINKDTGFGMRSSAQAAQKVGGAKINDAWKKLLRKAQGMSSVGKKQLIPHLNKLASEAAKRGFTLDPDPARVLGKAYQPA